MENNKEFWDKTALIYSKFTYGGGKAKKAFDEMIKCICESLNKDMNVLELAAGPGVISFKIADQCKSREATDFSKNMINQAKKHNKKPSIHFSVQDATKLPYKNESFDAVFICPTFIREENKTYFS